MTCHIFRRRTAGYCRGRACAEHSSPDIQHLLSLKVIGYLSKKCPMIRWQNMPIAHVDINIQGFSIETFF